MKLKTATVLLVAVLALGASDVFAQGAGFNFIGTGARARGMGGAFIGVADDATAISWNPAGLATLEKMEGSVVGYYNSTKTTLEVEYGGSTSSNDYSQSHPVFNFGSFAIPLTASDKNFVIAAAYQRLIDLYSLEEDSTYKEEFKGGVDAISPGAAVQLTPEIAVGAAFNIWMGGIDYEYDDKVGANDTSITELDKFSGFNVNIGVLFQKDKFKFGAVAKTPLTLKDKYKSGGNTYEWKYKFPFTYGFGISVAPNENLTLAADVDIRPYSNTEIEDVDFDTTYTDIYENSTQFRVGLEYLIIGENNIFPLRLGYHTEPYPYKIWDKKVTGNYITAGFGVIFGNVWIDAAYEYGMLNVDASDLVFAGDKWKYKDQIHNIILSAIVHFE